ncbi:histidinol-phosphatase, inositol monophosphatase family [Ruegeria halocynthiae]|uniref:Histidinol-phosphatase, inositol monophosphatase family n=1 Tax=Ruegeria halocynthiae TaxID=985054 RepID=A0A1H3BHS1_9RHOB|nr:inositol monophosphatase family protein [Ruegeria halocynthiae]SDX40599.1 histidinol-phosphatase, inositol monophosphatase family [Ruegeria halocynthiae]
MLNPPNAVVLPATTADIATHATEIARIAADAARGYFRGRLGVEFKADESPVTQADKGVEAVVRQYLADHFPDDGIFGEEQGFEGSDRQNVWIVDPIDGTRSFLSGHPLFGFLLGYLTDGVPRLGVIGMPALDEVLLGMKDQGASLNGKPVSVSATRRLSDAVLFVNEGDKIYRDHPALFDRLMKSGQTRRFAYDCYPHALLAMGHVDAVIDYDLQPYDYLPVTAVVEAAGGIMSDWDGKPLNLNSDGRVISAATPQLHAELLELVNG